MPFSWLFHSIVSATMMGVSDCRALPNKNYDPSNDSENRKTPFLNNTDDQTSTNNCLAYE